MADKTSFTKDEWALLLKSPMIAGMAVTAADPSGLWGLLKESFAGGAALTKVATDANANALIKAVVADFSTSEGRSTARDGLQAEFSGAKPAAIKTKSIDSLQPGFSLAGREGARRRSRVQGLAASDQSKHRRSGERGRRPVRRWSSGERRRKGDTR